MVNDTIVALATGGTGALSVIRISGPSAKAMVQKHVGKNLSHITSHSLHLTLFKSQASEPIDEMLLAYFEEGKSFTGEETVELHCHGSTYIQQSILQALTAAGARMAEPGEFTQRAFANGKMDLSQAEAVADLIASNSRQSHAVAFNQLRGGFSHELQGLREKLIEFASLLELELDFGEEDVAFADRTTLLNLVSEVSGKVTRLMDSFSFGNAMKEGVPVAIVGAPNAGKSSLLNRLLGEDRAIVSEIPGTTRDVIEATIRIDGMVFRLMDTAGIRETSETIESLGIARSQEKIQRSRMVIALSDGSNDQQLQEDRKWVSELRRIHPDKFIVWIANKADLGSAVEGVDLSLSALTGEGIDALKESMSKRIKKDFDVNQETIVSNVRHWEALYQTANSLKRVTEGLEQRVPADLVALDLRAAMRTLGNITGEIEMDTDILGAIFSRFCIGK